MKGLIGYTPTTLAMSIQSCLYQKVAPPPDTCTKYQDLLTVFNCIWIRTLRLQPKKLESGI